MSLGGQQENNCRSPVDVMTTPNVEAEKSYKVHFFFCVFLPIKCLFGTVLAVSLLGVMLNYCLFLQYDVLKSFLISFVEKIVEYFSAFILHFL